jgi:SSS family solute:Na+ symporter
MILSKDNPEYINLPGIGVLLGGMWIMNISYWGFNQYIIQRALGAKSLEEAQRGILFAAFLKMLMPFIIVVPGIAAAMLAPELPKADQAYPEMMKLAPIGLKGLIFAALIAAIVSSLGSMINSIASIFTMDLVRPLVAQKASEQRLVTIGRSASFVALVIALFLATPLLGNSPQVFQNIQNWTGFFTPGVVAIFTLGMFWKRATEIGGLVAVLSSVALSLVWPVIFPDMPFMDRVGIVFLLALTLGAATSYLQRPQSAAKVVDLGGVNFKTGPAFNIGAVIITLMLIGLYAYWW